MNHEACPLCNSSRRSTTITAREMSAGTRHQFTYFECGACGSVYIGNVPDNLGTYYEKYYSFGSDGRNLPKGGIRESFDAHLGTALGYVLLRAGKKPARDILRSPPPWMWRFCPPNLQAFLYAAPARSARILDVGAGDGAFVTILRALGYRSSAGIDPFLPEERPGLVSRGDIHSVHGQFDVVVMNHSFEHMPDPISVLKRSRDLIGDNGTIIIHLPNVESPEFSRWKANWWGLHAPRHLFLPSKSGMRLAAHTAGLDLFDAAYTSRTDHYCYSTEYSLDIDESCTRSIRWGQKSSIWSRRDLKEKMRFAFENNNRETGDWVAYYLRRQKQVG